MYAIMYDTEVNAMHVAMNDVEEKDIGAKKKEYVWYVIWMHDLKFILQDKKKKMLLCVLVRWHLRLGISNVKTLIWIAAKLNLLVHGF